MIKVDDITKTYKTKQGATTAVRGVSFDVPTGSFFTLLGPSGCGKTSTMRCIAGLLRPDQGTIKFADLVVCDGQRRVWVPTEKRPIGMVFQSYAIWPHMTVFDNVAYPLRTRRVGKAELTSRVNEALEVVGLGGMGARLAPMLSGGQQQRVALARAIVSRPQVLILDEPLSNLDAALREQMRTELKRLQRSLGVTTVYVTHDQHEAMALSDEVAVMRNGSLIQSGPPDEIYYAPKTRFVAEFLGATNMLSGTLSAAGSQTSVTTDIGVILTSEASDGLQPGSQALVSIRPEAVRFVDESDGGAERPMRAMVTERTFLGEHVEYMVAVGDRRLRSRRPSTEPHQTVGSEVLIALHQRGCVALAADDEPADPVAAADAVPPVKKRTPSRETTHV